MIAAARMDLHEGVPAGEADCRDVRDAILMEAGRQIGERLRLERERYRAPRRSRQPGTGAMINSPLLFLITR